MQHICLDIDDTITYAPEFFRHLVDSFESAKISIVTFREDLPDTREYLASVQVRYDHLYVSSDPEFGKKETQSLHQWKATLVNEIIMPDIFFEDMPEVIAAIDEKITVFMPCDSVIRQWIQSNIGYQP